MKLQENYMVPFRNFWVSNLVSTLFLGVKKGRGPPKKILPTL